MKSHGRAVRVPYMRLGREPLGVLLGTVLAACATTPPPQTTTVGQAEEARGPEVQAETAAESLQAFREAALGAYIAGYPAVEIRRTRDVATNVAQAGTTQAPINQFAHLDRLITPRDQDVVTPNNDTPYSTAFLDLAEQPLVLHLPAFGDRYFTVPLLSAYHEHFASIGQRSEAADGELAIAAPQGGDFLLTGPAYVGEVPEGVTQVPCPTNDVWVIMRPLVNGPADMAALMKLKRQIRLTPLSHWGEVGYEPPAGQVRELPSDATKLGQPMAGVAFYAMLADVVANNPPPASEAAFRAQLSTLGIGEAGGFDAAALSLEQRQALEEASQEAIGQIQSHVAQLGRVSNGWRLPTGVQGLFHGDYLRRAAYGLIGLGVINSVEAVYPMALVDADGEPLDGHRAYRLRFGKDELPQVRAFWSLTMYGEDKFLVDNALDRYSLGDRSRLHYAPDGSLTLLLQHARPEKKAELANWLPAPEGPFYVVLRMYHPSAQAAAGEVVPPPIRKVP